MTMVCLSGTNDSKKGVRLALSCTFGSCLDNFPLDVSVLVFMLIIVVDEAEREDIRFISMLIEIVSLECIIKPWCGLAK